MNSAWPVSGAAVAPGSIASMYGTSLALDTLLVSAPWPQTLGGASILTNGKPAAMFYVSPGQINFQVPWEAAGSTQGTVSITTGGIPSARAKFQPGRRGSGPVHHQSAGHGASRGAGGQHGHRGSPHGHVPRFASGEARRGVPGVLWNRSGPGDAHAGDRRTRARESSGADHRQRHRDHRRRSRASDLLRALAVVMSGYTRWMCRCRPMRPLVRRLP